MPFAFSLALVLGTTGISQVANPKSVLQPLRLQGHEVEDVLSQRRARRRHLVAGARLGLRERWGGMTPHLPTPRESPPT